MTAITLKLVLDDMDFGYLTENSSEWAANATDWEPKVRAGRFQVSKPGVQTGRWKYVYWLGGDYAAVIIARAFLAAWGEGCEVAWDTAVHPNGEPLGWVIFTDYESPVWQRARESERKG